MLFLLPGRIVYSLLSLPPTSTNDLSTTVTAPLQGPAGSSASRDACDAACCKDRACVAWLFGASPGLPISCYMTPKPCTGKEATGWYGLSKLPFTPPPPPPPPRPSPPPNGLQQVLYVRAS